MIEKCSIGNMSYNIQNITLIILILILIIVIIYDLKNSSAKHDELIEKYTTPTETIVNVDNTSSHTVHDSIANSKKHSQFPTSEAVVTLRPCQVHFNNTFDDSGAGTYKYFYEDGWQEIETLRETSTSTANTIPNKIISAINETNKDDVIDGKDIFTNYSEQTRCFKSMSGTDNKYRYRGNNLINYITSNHAELKLSANGMHKPYMQMEFNLLPANSSAYYDNLTRSICSLKYADTVTGLSGNLIRLTLDNNNIITDIKSVTVNATNNHIFNINSEFKISSLITSVNSGIYSYNANSKSYEYTATNSSSSSLITPIELYKFDRNLLCDKTSGTTTYQDIKTYQKLSNAKIDIAAIVNFNLSGASTIPNTELPSIYSTNTNITGAGLNKDTLLANINTLIDSELVDINSTTNVDIVSKGGEKTALQTLRTNFITANNTKQIFIDNAIIKTNYDDDSGLKYYNLINAPNYNFLLNEVKYANTTYGLEHDQVRIALNKEPTIKEILSGSTEQDVYEIKAYTYKGSGDFTQDSIYFPSDTLCDILIVGGGGGGGGGHGGGGGAGQLVFIHQATLNGTYNIKVGKGGDGAVIHGYNDSRIEPTKGSDSHFGTVIAKGGGANGGANLKNGGSGAGSDAHIPDGGSNGGGIANTDTISIPSGTLYRKGNNGGNSAGFGSGGGGGGAGTAGSYGGHWHDSELGHGGHGLSGISDINYDFKTKFGNYGKLESDGNSWFAGGGGGGVWYQNENAICYGGRGGGGSTQLSLIYKKVNGDNGVDGTGGGGAGGSAWYGNGGKGGSGIVILRYKLYGKIKTTNETIHTKMLTLQYNEISHTHIYRNNDNLTLNTQTKADILIVGGGGGGGFDGGGGGGGGEVKYYTDKDIPFKTGPSQTLGSGTYNIRIGIGGSGGTTITSNGTNGNSSSIIKNNISVYQANGGGGGGSRNNTGNKVRGGGSGGNGHANGGGSISSDGNGGSGGTNGGGDHNTGGGGGGGGANITSKNGLNSVRDRFAGNGGSGVDIDISGAIVGYGGGGGGGSYATVGGIATHGGGNGNVDNNIGAPVAGIDNTGGGGGSGGHAGYNPRGKKGGSGIVIIKYSYENTRVYKLNVPEEINIIIATDETNHVSQSLKGTYRITISPTSTVIAVFTIGDKNTIAIEKTIQSNKINIIYNIIKITSTINSTDIAAETSTVANIYAVSASTSIIPYTGGVYNKYKISTYISKTYKSASGNGVNFNIKLYSDTAKLIETSKYSIRYTYTNVLDNAVIIPVNIHLTIKPTTTMTGFTVKTYSRTLSGIDETEIYAFIGNGTGTNSTSIDTFNNITNTNWATSLQDKNVWGIVAKESEINTLNNNIVNRNNIANKCITLPGTKICDVNTLIAITNTITNKSFTTNEPSLKQNISLTSFDLFPMSAVNPILNYSITDYISYESSTLKAPANRTTSFDITSNATKYIYFKKMLAGANAS